MPFATLEEQKKACRITLVRVREHSRKPLAGTEGQLRQQGSPSRLWAQEKGG